MHFSERCAEYPISLDEGWASQLVERALKKRTREWARAVLEDGLVSSLRTDEIDNSLKVFE